MENIDKIKCVLIDFEQNDKTLDEAANEILRLFSVVGRSEQLVAFLKWVGDGYDFENNAEKIVKEYIDEGN